MAAASCRALRLGRAGRGHRRDVSCAGSRKAQKRKKLSQPPPAEGALEASEAQPAAEPTEPQLASAAAAPAPAEDDGPERDFWEGEQFDAFGSAFQAAIFAIPLLTAVVGGIAASTYNQGATGVDYTAGGVPSAATETAIKASRGV